MLEKIGIGIDIIDINRFSEKPYFENKLFYQKIFHNSEIEYCLNHKNSSVILTNFSYAKKGFRKSVVNIKFWREKDQKFLEKKIVISDNGGHYLNINKDKKIKSFLGKETCWATFDSDNPFLAGYYLEDMGSGIIGADHMF